MLRPFNPAALEPDLGPHAFESVTIEADVPTSIRRLHALLASLREGVLWAKGVLDLVEQPHHRSILQMSGRRATITVGAAWGSGRPYTQIVFIGIGGLPTPKSVQSALITNPAGGCGTEPTLTVKAAAGGIRSPAPQP